MSRPRRSLIHGKRPRRAGAGPSLGDTVPPTDRVAGPGRAAPPDRSPAAEPLPTPTPRPPPPGGAGASDSGRRRADRPAVVFTPMRRMFGRGDRPPEEPTGAHALARLPRPVLALAFTALGLAAAGVGAALAGLSWLGLAAVGP